MAIHGELNLQRLHHLQQLWPTANLHSSPVLAGVCCERCTFGHVLGQNPKNSALFPCRLCRHPNLTSRSWNQRPLHPAQSTYSSHASQPPEGCMASFHTEILANRTS
jgi:hypothetical protein